MDDMDSKPIPEGGESSSLRRLTHYYSRATTDYFTLLGPHSADCHSIIHCNTLNTSTMIGETLGCLALRCHCYFVLIILSSYKLYFYFIVSVSKATTLLNFGFVWLFVVFFISCLDPFFNLQIWWSIFALKGLEGMWWAFSRPCFGGQLWHIGPPMHSHH